MSGKCDVCGKRRKAVYLDASKASGMTVWCRRLCASCSREVRSLVIDLESRKRAPQP